jgi:hypothetical protein
MKRLNPLYWLRRMLRPRALADIRAEWLRDLELDLERALMSQDHYRYEVQKLKRQVDRLRGAPYGKVQ